MIEDVAIPQFRPDTVCRSPDQRSKHYALIIRVNGAFLLARSPDDAPKPLTHNEAVYSARL